MTYYSGGGNTEEMANIILESAKAAGAEIEMVEASEADATEMLAADVIVMGSSACGEEEIDGDYIEPLMEAFDGAISGKKVALFGAYGWGGGEFMETWVSRIEDMGATVIGHVAGEEGPGEVEDELKELGTTIANA